MSDSSRHPLHELVEEYVLDLLDDGEKAEFETRLATDAALAQSVAAAREALAASALSTPVLPPPDLKARVMAKAVPHAVEVVPEEARVLKLPVARRSMAPLWLGAALAASLVAIVKLSSDLANERAASAEARATLAQSSIQMQQRDSTIARLTSPEVELVTLVSTGAVKPSIKAYVDTKRGRMVLAVTSLEAVPTGKTYQLWFIETGKPPMPSVTFETDASGHRILTDVPLPTGPWSVAAITVEPTGGSAAPTSAPILAGQRASR
ncbi:MAG: anti-sigma factor [Gemmatimonadales bacterium]